MLSLPIPWRPVAGGLRSAYEAIDLQALFIVGAMLPFVPARVAICVSAAFVTPIAHESTILVMGPGKYRFADDTRLGLPFALLTWLVTSLLLPLRHPLRG